jgi:hypothetical protein
MFISKIRTAGLFLLGIVLCGAGAWMYAAHGSSPAINPDAPLIQPAAQVNAQNGNVDPRKPDVKKMPEVKLPEDPKAVVIMLDIRPANKVKGPPGPPWLAIHRDGKVVVTDRGREDKTMEGKITADELKDLMHFCVVTNKFFAINNMEFSKTVKKAIDDAGIADKTDKVTAPRTRILVQTADGNQEIICHSLEICAANLPKCEPIQRLAAIQERLLRILNAVDVQRKQNNVQTK